MPSRSLRVKKNGLERLPADAIAGLNPMSVEISLYGATAEVHDKITLKRGSFAFTSG